jgi:hypothetical protein
VSRAGLPAQVHVADQRALGRGEGPIALVVAPTRELAEQIHREARKFARAYSECAAAGVLPAPLLLCVLLWFWLCEWGGGGTGDALQPPA